MTRSAVIQRDRGWRRIRKDVEELGESEIRVGIQHDAGAEPDGTSLVEVAVWNEFGTETIPSRPFMRRTADEKRRAVGALGEGFLKRVIAGSVAPSSALHQIGLWFAAEVVKTINSSASWAAPNAPSTIAAKGSSHPLVDTSHLRKNIKHIVRRKGGGGS